MSQRCTRDWPLTLLLVFALFIIATVDLLHAANSKVAYTHTHTHTHTH